MVMPEGDDNAQSNRSENTGKEKRQLCFDITKAAYDFTVADIAESDANTTQLITFVVVLLGIYATLGPNLLNSINKTYYNLYLYILTCSFVMILLAILFAIIANRLSRLAVIPSIPYFYEHYIMNDEKTKNDTIDALTLAFISGIQLNNELRNRKWYLVSLSFTFLLGGLLASIIFIYLTFIAPKS